MRKEFAKKVPYDFIREKINSVITAQIDDSFSYLKNDFWIKESDDIYFQFIEVDLGKGIACYVRWGVGFYTLPLYENKCKISKLVKKSGKMKYHLFELSKFEEEIYFKGKKLVAGKSCIDLFSGERYFVHSLDQYFKKNKKQIAEFLRSTDNYEKACKRIKFQAEEKRFSNHFPNPLVTYCFYLSSEKKYDEASEVLSKYFKYNNSDQEEKNFLKVIVDKIKYNNIE